jgi:probable rRNA maturation factor
MGDGTRRGPSRRALQLLVVDDRGRPVSAPGLARWVARVAPARARGLVCVAIVSDGRVRGLNRVYRGIDRPTDVLSFAAANCEARSASREPVPAGHFLGDIVIARGVARRQAREAGHSERTELRVLALHGLLHLLGYDHERDDGRMARVEQRLRRMGGVGEGLIERTVLARSHGRTGR